MKHIDKTAVEKPLHVAYTPRHAKDRLLERLGAAVFDVDELMRETFTGNPFRGVR